MRARIATVVAAAWLMAVPASAGSNLPAYVVASYPVDATAKDAVAAKAQAMADGEVGAFRYLMKRLVGVGAYKRLPRLSADTVENLVADVSVRDEHNSATQYIATLAFNFKADAVGQLLQSYKLPYTDKQSPKLVVVPVFSGPAGKSLGASLAIARKNWLDAWKGLDLEHALTPVKIADAGASATPDTFKRLSAGDTSALGIISGEVPADRLVVALAEPTADGKQLQVTLIGQDWVGPVYLQRRYSNYYDDLSYTSEFAAIIALGVLEGRWKMSAIDGGDQQGSAWNSDGGGGGVPVHVSVQFQGVEEWQRLRGALLDAEGVDQVRVGELTGQSAEVDLAYPGGPAGLAAILSRQGLTVEDNGGGLVLRAN